MACSAGSPELLPDGSWTLRPEPCPAWMFPDFGLRGHALSSAELQAALGLSKGAASMILRELEQCRPHDRTPG